MLHLDFSLKINKLKKEYKFMIYVSFRILPESARWLITQGKKDVAIKEIRRAAKVNGRKVPEELLDKVKCIRHI